LLFPDDELVADGALLWSPVEPALQHIAVSRSCAGRCVGVTRGGVVGGMRVVCFLLLMSVAFEVRAAAFGSCVRGARREALTLYKAPPYFIQTLESGYISPGLSCGPQGPAGLVLGARGVSRP